MGKFRVGDEVVYQDQKWKVERIVMEGVYNLGSDNSFCCMVPEHLVEEMTKPITYRVPIRCIATGETIVYEETLPWYDIDSDEGNSLHWWTDGDRGCDCNRHLLFMRAKHGEDWDEDKEIKCGDRESYFIPFIELPDGSKITCDEEP